MTTNRLKSIVPMFGGGEHYVTTLNSLLNFIDSRRPTTDELIEWHRETFTNVSSRSSIMRRVTYLRKVGFIHQFNDHWELDTAGEEYTQDYESETLLRIMCDRNIGLRSLLYALSTGPLTIEEISIQQLETHPELGWDRTETDMAFQRANWLRSMGLVEKNGKHYRLTSEGSWFVNQAVTEWTPTEETPAETDRELTADVYETRTYTRALDPEFRATVLSRYDRTCPVSGVDHAGLLDVAHVLSWSEYPNHRADLSNVLPLSKTHHAAFDRGLFTIDQDYRLRVNPSFETQSTLLQQTLLNQTGERITVPDQSVDPNYLRQHNAALEWF